MAYEVILHNGATEHAMHIINDSIDVLYFQFSFS